jgi:hypothetical protein
VECRALCFITAGPSTKLFAWGGRIVEDMCYERRRAALVCVFYYCRTYYKAVRVGGGGEWR